MTLKVQAKGSSARILVDFELVENQANGFSDRLPAVVPFNTSSFVGERALNRAETITGDRSASEPFQGNLNVGGNVDIPVDDRLFGYFLKLAMGSPVESTDQPVSAENRLLNGPVTLTIASGEGTFDVAQTTAAVGDRVIYTDGTNIYSAYLTAETSDTVWDMDTARAGSSNAPDITDADVLFIVANRANATPGTVSITSGVATFSNAPTAMAAGSLLIYDGGSRARVKTVISSTSAVLEGQLGVAPANETDVAVESVESSFRSKHRFVVDPIASNPTATFERGFRDMGVPLFERFRGCKVDSIDFNLGGDQELLASIALVGAGKDFSYQPYDVPDHWSGSGLITISGTGGTFSSNQTATAVGDWVVWRDATGEEQRGKIAVRGSDTGITFDVAPGNVTGATLLAIYPSADTASIARSPFGDRFQQFDASIKLNGEAVQIFTEFQLQLANTLDGDQYPIGAQGTRASIPEGTFFGTGSFVFTLLKDQLLRAGSEFSTVTLEAILTRGTTGKALSIYLEEVKVQDRSPGVQGPAGVRVNQTFEAYKTSGSTIIAVELTGNELGYDRS